MTDLSNDGLAKLEKAWQESLSGQHQDVADKLPTTYGEWAQRSAAGEKLGSWDEFRKRIPQEPLRVVTGAGYK